MATTYFEKLRTQGKKLDDGVQKLSEIWKSPNILIGGYGDNATEANAYAEKLFNDIKNIEDQMVVESTQRTQNILETDLLLDESRNLYESISRQCDDIETVFMEYGYTRLPCGIRDRANDESNVEAGPIDSNFISDDHQVEFTPDLTWRCRSRTSDLADTPSTSSNESCLQSAVTTPLINDLASAMKLQVSNARKQCIKCTPARERPKEPIFSSHFYSILKE